MSGVNVNIGGKIGKRLQGATQGVRVTAVQIGAANLVDPYICRDIIEDLPRVMDEYKINTLSEIIGGVQ